MIEGITSDGKAPPFHGVSKDHTWSVGYLVTSAVTLNEPRYVVATKVLNQEMQFIVGNFINHASYCGISTIEESMAKVRASEGEKRLVFLVRHVINVLSQYVAITLGEGTLKSMAVLGFHHVPAGSFKKFHELFDLLSRNNSIKTLSIGVNNPHDIAESLQCGIGDGFPHVPLVKFGIAS